MDERSEDSDLPAARIAQLEKRLDEATGGLKSLILMNMTLVNILSTVVIKAGLDEQKADFVANGEQSILDSLFGVFDDLVALAHKNGT